MSVLNCLLNMTLKIQPSNNAQEDALEPFRYTRFYMEKVLITKKVCTKEKYFIKNGSVEDLLETRFLA